MTEGDVLFYILYGAWLLIGLWVVDHKGVIPPIMQLPNDIPNMIWGLILGAWYIITWPRFLRRNK